MEDACSIQDQEIRKLKRAQAQFLLEIEPIVNERVKLSMMFSSIIMFEDGSFKYNYPEDVRRLDNKYIELIELTKRYCFAKNP